MGNLKVIINISLLITLYYIVYYFYTALLYPIPPLGDSWDYHIPIAKTILNGTFLHPQNFELSKWYYPGSAEAFLSLFIFFDIPMTLSNLPPILLLFFACWKLAQKFGLNWYYGLLFPVTFITLNAIVRWMVAISIDVWIAVFFTFAILLLETPKKSIIYFLKLGFVIGMLVGSKYAAWYFLIPLALFYTKSLLPTINISRLLAFFIPFSIFGLFWYIRNYIYMQNPFYPIAIAGFEGEKSFETVLQNGLAYPLVLFNAGFGEYKLWLFSAVIALVVLVHHFVIKKDFSLKPEIKLFLIGLICLSFYPTFPTSAQPWSFVSSFRYTFPAFIPLILGIFILAKKYKKEELIGYVVIANMINVLSMAYYPKLVLIYLPLSLILFYFLDKYAPKIKSTTKNKRKYHQTS